MTSVEFYSHWSDANSYKDIQFQVTYFTLRSQYVQRTINVHFILEPVDHFQWLWKLRLDVGVTGLKKRDFFHFGVGRWGYALHHWYERK